MAAEGNGNGYVTLSTLVTALVGMTIALGTIGGAIIGLTYRALSIQIESHEKRLDKDETIITPSDVNKEHWAAQDAQFTRIEQQIGDINSEIGNAYNLKDALSHLQTQVDKLNDSGKGKPEGK